MSRPGKTPSVDDLMAGLSRDSQEALRVRNRPVVIPPRPVSADAQALPRPRWSARLAAIALAALVVVLAIQGWSAWTAGDQLMQEVRQRIQAEAHPPPEPLPPDEELRNGERFAHVLLSRPAERERLLLARIEAFAVAERWNQVLDAAAAARRDFGVLPASADLRRAQALYGTGDLAAALATAMAIDGNGLSDDLSGVRAALIGRCHQRLSQP